MEQLSLITQVKQKFIQNLLILENLFAPDLHLENTIFCRCAWSYHFLQNVDNLFKNDRYMSYM